MRFKIKAIFLGIIIAVLLLGDGGKIQAGSGSINLKEVPVKGMVTMIDLGAGTCIPCRLMSPILDKLTQEYQGKAAIIFIDLSKDFSQVQRFNIQVSPTQIFYDRNGQEVFRHSGYMSEKAIRDQLNKMGIR